MGREVSPGEDFQNLVRLTRIVRRFRPDVLHLHSSKAGALGRLAARLTGVPTVFSPHNFAHTGHEGSERVRNLYLMVERALAPLTDQLHLTFDQERREALRLGLARPGRVTVVPNGAEIAPLLSIDGANRDPPTIGTFARLWPQKRIDVLLRAASLLVQKDLPFRLAVIGDGPLKGELEELAAHLGLADRTVFMEAPNGAEAAMKEIDIYVLSSSQEAFPLVPIEAMAAGRPVVASAVGAVPEIVTHGETGLLVPPADEAALARALGTLIADPSLRRRMGESGRHEAKTRFPISAMNVRMEELYRAAIQ